MVNALANIFLVIAALGALTFVTLYAVYAPWRSTAIGRNVMAFMIVALVLLTLGILRNFLPVDRFLDEIRLAAYIAVAVIIWRRVWLLIKAQRIGQ